MSKPQGRNPVHGYWTRQRLVAAVSRGATQLAVLFVVLQAYSYVRKTYFQQPSEHAYANAIEIIDLQAALAISVHRVELPLQRAVIEHTWLVDFFNAYYRQMKPAVFASAVLAAVIAPVGYRRIRRLFLLTTIIAFPWYALFPLAPPRLMDDRGYPFVDTLAAFGGTVSSASGAGGANQFAAMPSMHIGWSIIAALWLAVALPRRRIGTVLGCAHVAIMTVTVMATGNHYLLDVVGGIAVVGVAFVLDRALINVSWSAVRQLVQRADRELV